MDLFLFGSQVSNIFRLFSSYDIDKSALLAKPFQVITGSAPFMVQFPAFSSPILQDYTIWDLGLRSKMRPLVKHYTPAARQHKQRS